MKKMTMTIKGGKEAMPKKIHFEWELPDGLLDTLAHDRSEMAETIKAAAALDWVRTHKLSLRRGATLLQIPYRAFVELMAAHRVPTIDYEAGWLEREQQLFTGQGSVASS